MIVRPCSQAIVALTFSIYASKPFFPECDPPDEAVRSVNQSETSIRSSDLILASHWSKLFIGSYLLEMRNKREIDYNKYEPDVTGILDIDNE